MSLASLGRNLKRNIMKTSKLLCMILDNEGEIESSNLLFFLKELTKLGYVEVNGTKIKLTDRGKCYARSKNNDNRRT